MYKSKMGCRLLGHPDSSHTHTGTDAHGSNADLLVRPVELSQQCADLAGAGAAKRVAEGNGTTLGVDLFSGEAKLVGAPHALGSKSLVDLEDVDIVLGDAGLLQSNGDGLPGANTHEQGLDTDDASSDVFANDLLAQALSSGTLHEQNGGGTVRDLGGIAGVDGAVLGEGRADLAQGLGGDTLTDTVVGLDSDGLLLTGLGVGPLDIKRGDLLVEEAGLLGGEGLLVGRGGEGVLGGTGDVAVLGHVLRQDTHRDLAVGGLGVVLEEVGEFGDSTRAVLRGHALNTSTDTNVDHAGLQSVGNVDDGLQTTGALTVQTLDGGSLGETGHKGSGTEFGRTTTGSENGANGDILDGLGVDTALVNHGLEDTGQQVGGGGVLEATLSTLGQGCSQSTCHHNIIGVLLGEAGSSLLAGGAEVGGDLVQTLRCCRKTSA